jgi:hypothetical protein
MADSIIRRSRFVDLTSQRFGRWTVIQRAASPSARHIHWRCRCDCGNEKSIAGESLKGGRSRSCGCLNREVASQRARATQSGPVRRTHGKSATSEFRIWAGILTRCYNQHATGYPNYGGRGITVCDRWRDSFENFLADMGPRPSSQHSVDRWPNQAGPYEPGNVRWATRQQQSANTRRTINVTIDGVSLTLKAACQQCGLPYQQILKRVRRGIPPEHALHP